MSYFMVFMAGANAACAVQAAISGDAWHVLFNGSVCAFCLWSANLKKAA